MIHKKIVKVQITGEDGMVEVWEGHGVAEIFHTEIPIDSRAPGHGEPHHSIHASLRFYPT